MLIGDLKPFMRDSTANTAPVSSSVISSFGIASELRSYVMVTPSRMPSRVSTSRSFCSNLAPSATAMWNTLAWY